MTTELIKKIETAFKNTPKPTGESCHKSSATNYFSGKSWKDLSTTELRQHSDALYDFEPEAFRYYLPAFLLADINDPIEADIIGESIVSIFTPRADERLIDKEYKNKRIALFSKQEMDAVVAFISWFSIEYNGFVDAKQAIEYLKIFIRGSQENSES
jgi:hypothetical protein